MDRAGARIAIGALLMGGMLGSSGCAYDIWFTQPLREAYELGVVARTAAPPEAEQEAAANAPEPARTPAELQYFVSDRIVLEREVTSRSDSLAKGRIKVRRGRYVEQVVVRRNTPGVAVDWGRDWVAISFEEGSALVFSVDADDAQPSDDDLYRLQVRRPPEGVAAVAVLDGRQYDVRQGGHARLQVHRESRTKRSRSRRVLHGRRLATADASSNADEI